MTVIAMASLKAAPGVTTSALALSAAWPAGPRVVLAELDSSGGDIAAFYPMEQDRGLASLAAASRQGKDPGLLSQYAQRLPGGLEVLAAPVNPAHAHATVNVLATTLPETLSQLTEDTSRVAVLDLGRLTPGGPGLALVRAASRVLLVMRPDIAELAHAHACADQLRDAFPGMELLLVGEGQHSPRDVERALGMPVRARLAWDPRSAALLRGEGHRPRRTPLLDDVNRLAGSLHNSIAAAQEPSLFTPIIAKLKAESARS